MSFRTFGAGVVGAVAVALAGTAYSQSAVQWRVADGGNGHWYRLVAAPGISWANASSQAQNAGGSLATLVSAAENTFVVSSLAGSTTRYPWIGLRQAPEGAEPGSGWGWISGEPLSWTNWSPSEPNGDGVAFADEANLWLVTEPGRPLGTWNDWTTGGPDGYIVEWSSDCNADGIVDYGQVLDGSLPDLNVNGVPDVCDLSPSAPQLICWGRSGEGWCPLSSTGSPIRWALGGAGWSAVVEQDGTVRTSPFLSGMASPFTEITDVAMDNSILVLADGQVFAYGMNNYGQVSSIPPNLAGVRKVACGAYANGVVFWNGTVACWGNVGMPNVPGGLTGVRDLHLSHNAAFAVRSDNSMVAWGQNWRGELNIPSDLGAIRAMEVGDWHAIALRIDGSIRCWGDNGHGQLNVPPGLGEVIEVQASGGWTDSGRCMVLRRDGSVVSWGSNQYGEGTPPSQGPFRYLYAANRHTVAITGHPDCNGDGIYDHRQIRDGELVDGDRDGIPDVCQCPSDVNEDDVVGAEDLAYVLFAWGMSGGKAGDADINGDAIVDANDLSLVLGSWGPCPN